MEDVGFLTHLRDTREERGKVENEEAVECVMPEGTSAGLCTSTCTETHTFRTRVFLLFTLHDKVMRRKKRDKN